MKTALLAALAALMLLAVPAFAAEVTRDEYTPKVEPICEKNKQESEKILKGVKKMVKQDKLKPAGVAFAKAASALEKAEKQLAKVPPSTGDEAKISKWLSDIKGEVKLMRQISTAFKSGNKGKGSSLVVKLEHNATAANNLMVAFQFDACRIDPSKFS